MFDGILLGQAAVHSVSSKHLVHLTFAFLAPGSHINDSMMEFIMLLFLTKHAPP